ncbi:MAG TPA: alpha/beta family hydrolase [Gemmatimonadaceae bacterium]|nr:alpha/beta family hydrolase [Gemmatimonadaceae bacterium]
MSWTVNVGKDTTTAIYDPGEGDAITDTVFICAHGAGGNMVDGGMQKTAKALIERGINLVRFNFLYKEKKSGRPDPMPKLQEAFAAVVEKTKEELAPKKIVIGGRSMGGRAASMMAAEGYACDGLLLYAYPLHPAGQPTKLRDAHLPMIKVPVLCFSGTRDALCTPFLMEKALESVTTDWTMHWVEGADHSFHVLKSSGRTDAQVMTEIADRSRTWILSLP